MSDIRRLKYEKDEKVRGRILCDNHARLKVYILFFRNEELTQWRRQLVGTWARAPPPWRLREFFSLG